MSYYRSLGRTITESAPLTHRFYTKIKTTIVVRIFGSAITSTKSNKNAIMNFLDHLRAQWFAALFGCILYIAAITILFWNEVHANTFQAIFLVQIKHRYVTF